jgi:hypothetical protein
MTKSEQAFSHVLTHIEASNPCSFASVIQWAKHQGQMAGFVQNINKMKAQGLIYMSESDDGELIIDLA